MEVLLYLLDIFIWAVILGLIPAFIAKNKNRNFTQWYIYGFLLYYCRSTS